jgi:hypothetical protein
MAAPPLVPGDALAKGDMRLVVRVINVRGTSLRCCCHSHTTLYISFSDSLRIIRSESAAIDR